MSLLSLLSFSCPLILSSLGALFTEYAGCLALFLEGLISFAAFLHYAFTCWTGSSTAGIIISSLICILFTTGFSLLIERFKANKFIAAIAINLFFSSLTSLLSWYFFKTRGVLASEAYRFSSCSVQISTIILSLCLIAAAIVFLKYSRYGLYIRITGSDAPVLKAKGVNPSNIQTLSWALAALYGSMAGVLLGMRLSSFVPNISSGRGWMALAAVFLGRKNPVRIIISVLIFCFADIFSANIQNYIQGIPNSFLLSFPYIISLILIFLPDQYHQE